MYRKFRKIWHEVFQIREWTHSFFHSQLKTSFTNSSLLRLISSLRTAPWTVIQTVFLSNYVLFFNSFFLFNQFFIRPKKWLWNTVMIMSVTVCSWGYLWNHTSDVYQFLCMLPMAVARSSSCVVAIRYVLQFCGWRHVFL